MTESNRSFEERSWDQEAGGPGSLTVSEVTEMQNLRRWGLSYRDIAISRYRDIAEFVKRPVSTVFKWTHMVTPEAFFEPGLSLQEKLSRHFGRPIVWPPPSETKPSKSSQVATTGSEPTMAAPADDTPTIITRTVQVFDATLYVARTRLGIVPFSVPGGVAKAFPDSKFVGYDFSKKAIAAAKAEAKRLKLSNALFAAKDVATLNEPKKYDLITAFDSIHDQAKPTRVLKAISRGLRPDGVFLLVDVAASSNLHENLRHPLGPFLYSISTMHCMTVSLAYGGEGLGTVWGEQLAKRKLSEAGFKSVEIRKVPGDILNSYYMARKSLA